MGELSEQKVVERKLLAEADYFYDLDDWHTTYHDLGDVCEGTDLDYSFAGRIISVGRLKALPTVFAVNLPVSYDEDGGVDEWEVSVFETHEAAQAAFRAAFPVKDASE